MTTPPAIAAARVATTPSGSRRVTRRGSAVSRTTRRAALPIAALLIAGLLVAGCDDGSAPSDGPVAPASRSAMGAASMERDGYRKRDEARVTSLVTAWDAAWNAGDAAGLAATFFDDAEFINAKGQLFQGAAEIQAQHVISLAGQFHGSHTEGHIRRITFLSGSAAVLDVDNDLTRYEAVPGSPTPRAIQQSGRHKRIVVKRNGVWRVLYFQNTMLATP